MNKNAVKKEVNLEDIVIMGVSGSLKKAALKRTYMAEDAVVEKVEHEGYMEVKTSLDEGWPFSDFVPVTYQERRYIQVPLIYFLRDDDRLTISNSLISDVVPHPLFVNADGSVAQSRLIQVSQEKWRISLNDFRKEARNLGDEYSIYDARVDSYLKILFTIQYAERDSKSIFPGYVAWKNNEPADAFATDIITTKSGYLPNGQFKWNGLEDIFGNRFEMLDGILTKNDDVYICLDPRKYASELNEHYVKVGKLPRADGWLKETTFNEDHSWLELPSVITDDKKKSPFSNYYWSPWNNDAVQTIITGGSWISVDVAGLWYWACYYYASDAFSTVGGRLLVSL